LYTTKQGEKDKATGRSSFKSIFRTRELMLPWRREQETGPGDEQQSKKSRNVYSRFPFNWGFV
jgi:hypothetical protein